MRGRIVIACALALCGCKGGESKLDKATTTRGSAGGAGSAAAGTEVKLCDNHTTVALTELPKDRAGGQAVADQLMAQWRRANPDAAWEANIRRSLTVMPPADNTNVLKGEQREAQTYGRYTELDVTTWAREAEKAALEGARVFHSADELGSTIAVSCDMCHPDAANTHPETYPKFQVQMGRVALLRDMINWCLEHPVRAAPMAADDPRMRAMEAYIHAQRAGTAMAYGKH